MLIRAAAYAAAIAAGLSLLFHAPVCAAAEPIPEANRIGGFAIGCQAYSFNRFTAFEAIEKTAQAGGRVIEFYPGQKLRPDLPDVRLDENLSDENIAQVKEKLQKHGLRAVNFGVVGLSADEAASRKVFEFARKMGIGTITTEIGPREMDTVEKLVKEYDIRVAIHNHPRRDNDPNYKVWDPRYVLDVVKNRDRRIGACADTGHWLTSGIEPVVALRLLAGRVISTHLKDRPVIGKQMGDVPYGSGVANIKAILDELRRQGFDGNISIEYENNWDNNVPDIAQCVGFVRGYAAVAAMPIKK